MDRKDQQELKETQERKDQQDQIRSSGTREVFGKEVTGGPGFISAFADCADDESVTGGGYIVSPQNSVADFIVNGNSRHIDGAGDHNGWSAQVFSTIEDVNLPAFAECAKLVPPP